MGRPTVLTPEKQKLIADCLFDGLTDTDIALFCEIDERTVRRARAAEFCPAIKKAELARKRHYIAKIRDGKSRDWVRIAWFLERRYPTEFARPEIQLSFNNNYTQNNLQINITSSEAKQIEQIAEPVRENVKRMFASYRPQTEGGNGNGNNP